MRKCRPCDGRGYTWVWDSALRRSRSVLCKVCSGSGQK